MAYAAAVNVDGNSEELLRRYDQVMTALRRRDNPPPGLISHYCMRTDSGIRVVNCYSTEQQARGHYEAAEFKEAIAQAGLQLPSPTMMQVHNYFHV